MNPHQRTAARRSRRDPARPDRRRTLRADQPAELLAEARLLLGAVPRDCLILVGHVRRRSAPFLARIGLERPLLAGPEDGRLAHLLEQMARQGCTGAFGLVVLGDGYERGPRDQEVAAAISWCAALLIEAARRPDPFDVPEMWVLAEERAFDVLVRPVAGTPEGTDAPDGAGAPSSDEAFDLAISPPQVLPPVDSTLVAAQAVAAGEALPVERPEVEAALERARPRIDALRRRLPAPPLEIAWERAVAALSRLGREPADPSGADHVTDCEHVAALLDLCDAPEGADTLLSLAVPSRPGSPTAGGACIDQLLTDPSLRPHRRICAGGHWYETLMALRRLCRPEGAGPGVEPPDQAWVSLTLALALLAWWNQRHATAAELAEEVLARRPGHGLALCLLQMTGIPVRPAWSQR